LRLNWHDVRGRINASTKDDAVKSGLLRPTLWIVAILGLPALLVSFWWAMGGANGGPSHPLTAGTQPVPTASAQQLKEPLSQTDAETFFTLKIRPVLEGTCFRCHGGEKVRNGLRVDSRAALLKGGEYGPALVPGDAGKSLIIQALRHAHDDIKMPPGKKLPATVINDFATWIDNGAAWPKAQAAFRLRKHWSFEPVTKIEPPADASGWSANPIDRFVVAKLGEHSLEPAGPADKHTLIRRATFDLIGLPPTPEEVEAFVADNSPDAFAKVVDRLLASPHYGERWGRHWLDVVRYADTAGFEADHLYPNAWQYRDYIIRTLNADKPFDRFLHEQIAGDELWPDDKSAVIASGLYCVGPVLSESAMHANQLEYEWLTDAVDTTGAAFLGLTVGCARCHDHKYDPLTQKDYFALQAIFAASDRPYPAKVRLLRIKGLNGLLSEAPVPKELLSDPRCKLQTDEDVGLRLFHRQEPMTVLLLHRGELSKPGEAVKPAFPAALVADDRPADFAAASPKKLRAKLAHWLTAPDNPLTARVLVNRVWGWHFGQALVRTPNDFGAQGEPPTHPELLDWLARDLMEHGWSLKSLHRRIMLSKTYQMQSVAGGRAMKVDPQNRLLWHFPRHRVEGEVIRDAMLACAGSLNKKQFGPAVVPPLGSQELTGLFDIKAKWPVTKDAAEHTRKSVYLLVRRTFVYPLFAAFDPPEVMTSCAQRTPTVVPAQALALLNSPLAREQAAAFAQRLLQECGNQPQKQVAHAWRLAFGRDITQAEIDRAVMFLTNRTAALARIANGQTTDKSVAAAAQIALAELCLALFNANEFVFVD
jgi:hypothetical protein